MKFQAKWKIKKGENKDEGYTKEALQEMFSKVAFKLNCLHTNLDVLPVL